MSESTAQLLLSLRARLRTALRRTVLAEVVFGTLVLVGGIASVLLLAVGAEALLWMGVAARSTLFVTYWAVAVGLSAFFVARPLLILLGVIPGVDERGMAERIGRAFPEVGDRLSALLDLSDGHGSSSPPSLVDRAVASLGRHVEPVPFENVADLNRARHVAPFAATPLFGVVLFALIAPSSFIGAVERLASPGEHFLRPAPFELHVAPGDATLIRGGTLDIIAEPVGRDWPPTARLVIEPTGERQTQTARLGLADGRYAHSVDNIRADFRYRLEAGPVTTRWYRVNVDERPAVQAIQVTVTPPRYTQLRPRQLEPGAGDVAALPGSGVALAVDVTGEEIESVEAVVRFGDGREQAVPLSISGGAASRSATGSFTMRGDGSYRIRLRSSRGIESVEPVTYRLTALTDAPPQVSFTDHPGGDLAPRGVQMRDLRLRISDDYGFSSLSLYWRRAAEQGEVATAFRRVALPFRASERDQQVSYRWMLDRTTQLLEPGQAIEFFVEVRDNDAPGGFKPDRTGTYRLSVPTVAERYRSFEEDQDEASANLEDLRQEADRARDNFRELRERLRRTQEPTWEDRRQLDRLQDQQRGMEERVDQLSQQMQQLAEQMRREDLASEETRRLYEELERVAAEIQSPELQQLLDQLREAMDNLQLPEMLERMEQFEMNEAQFRERLERALELFERLRTQQAFDEVARRAEDLAGREETLAEQAGETSEQDSAQREALAREQERAAQDAADLQRALEELQRRLEERGDSQQDALEQLMEEAGSSSLPQEMQQNAQQMRSGQMQPAQQQQQDMAQRLQQLSQQLGEMGAQMMQQQDQRSRAALRRALGQVLTLSHDQEDLRNQTARVGRDAPALQPLARRQGELGTGLDAVADTLRLLGREMPQMSRLVATHVGDARRDMTQSTESLVERRVPQAIDRQRAAMTRLNDLALLLSELMDQMEGGGGGGGGLQELMQQLQQTGGRQQQLNQQIQQMLNEVAGERLDGDREGRAGQMAQQQERLLRQLEQTLQQPGNAEHLDSQARSALQRALDQMEESARRLREGRLDRETVPRQEHILERLLEAERSVNQRGEEERREGETGLRRPPSSAPPLPEVEQERARLRRDLLRSLDSGYAPDYQQLIRRYFELLQEESRNGGTP